jgi:arginyl-tRNA synthetase
VTPASLSDAVLAAARTVFAARGLDLDALPERTSVERPRNPEHGDYASTLGLQLGKRVGVAPRELAAAIADELGRQPGVKSVEVAGPGFLNIRLDAAAAGALARDIVLAAGEYGHTDRLAGQRINLEFVSANPTGPVHVGGVRWAAVGDALARLLRAAGAGVGTEYYFNDAGSQIDRLGASVRAHARGEPVPEDGYQGAYVAELAGRIPGAPDGDDATVGREAAQLLMKGIRATLAAFNVAYDTWFLERSVHDGDPSAVDRALARLREQGHVYESEGAVWLRTSALGDEKDRVLIRSTGAPTYFAADVAYHEDKLERGFDRLIDVWGADHHGYVARVKAGMAALGADPDRLEVPLLQFVHIVENGGRASMSKRRGDFVTLDELIGEIGVDATRFFMLQRSQDSTIDLDLDLARSESSENPVYYVQYAHARIASMLRKAGEERVRAALAAEHSGLALEPAERELVKKLLAFPGEVDEAAAKRAPHRMATYALELAQAFTAFYRDCRVVGAEPEALESFRIALSVAAQRTIARCLDLLGVSAPESM